MRVRYNHPRVTPTHGAPSFLNDSEYRSNGILSLIVAVMWEEKSEPGPPPPFTVPSPGKSGWRSARSLGVVSRARVLRVVQFRIAIASTWRGTQGCCGRWRGHVI